MEQLVLLPLLYMLLRMHTLLRMRITNKYISFLILKITKKNVTRYCILGHTFVTQTPIYRLLHIWWRILYPTNPREPSTWSKPLKCDILAHKSSTYGYQSAVVLVHTSLHFSSDSTCQVSELKQLAFYRPKMATNDQTSKTMPIWNLYFLTTVDL